MRLTSPDESETNRPEKDDDREKPVAGLRAFVLSTVPLKPCLADELKYHDSFSNTKDIGHDADPNRPGLCATGFL